MSMTFWIVLGAVGVALWLTALIWFVALCVTARELSEDAHRDEHITSAHLYPTEDRDVRATVIRYMRRDGLTADDAVARTFEGRR